MSSSKQGTHKNYTIIPPQTNSVLTWSYDTVKGEEAVAKFGQVRDAAGNEYLQDQPQAHVDGHGWYENFVRCVSRVRTSQLDATDEQERPVDNGVREAPIPAP